MNGPSYLVSRSTLKMGGSNGVYGEKFKSKIIDIADDGASASKLKMKISRSGRGSERFKEVKQQPDGSYMMYTISGGVAKEKKISSRRAEGFIRRMKKSQKRLNNKNA